MLRSICSTAPSSCAADSAMRIWLNESSAALPPVEARTRSFVQPTYASYAPCAMPSTGTAIEHENTDANGSL